MKRQKLTDARYQALGYIDTAADGRQTGRDAQLHAIGYYDPHTDTTRDAQRRLVGKGNLLASLIASGRGLQ